MTEPNHHPTIGSARALGAQGPMHLDDITQVIGIVRSFVSEVVTDAEGAEEWCERMARVFTGQEAGYTPLADWNTGPRPGIARYLAAQIQGLPDFPTAHETVATAFGVLANRVLECHAETDGGPEWRRRSTNLIQMFSRMLVGQPQLPAR